ncbi:MAG: hypothetical protein CR997_00970 [Acidobacteria bacterium]|nr:MAG: hypothetical protein CR997_00970 [Acidobacteriota bacterium]
MQKKENKLRQIERHTLRSLEFETILNFYALNAKTRSGKQAILNMQRIPVSQLDRHYELLESWMLFLDKHDPLVIPEIPDPRCLDRNPAEKPLTSEELILFRNTLLFWNAFCQAEDLSEFRQTLLDDVEQDDGGLSDLLIKLKASFEPDGSWSASITPRFKKLCEEESRVTSRLDHILKEKVKTLSSQLTEHVIFERNGRRVLAVNKTYKRRVPGILIDYSTSGQTAFIEPDTTTPLQNRLQELFFEKREEIFQFRRELTLQLQKLAFIRYGLLPSVSRIDSIQALALTAMETNSFPVKPNHSQSLLLMNARHPLLDERFQKHREAVSGLKDRNRMVALTLRLDGDLKGQIISGANAGGKTVTIKTVGLLALMANHGLPIPADPDSELPYYERVFADIGDHQSLSHNLSTYASHLESMKTILQPQVTNKLILLDELGSGTDPHEGNALAQALIEECVQQGAHLLVTTHQQVLCSFALNHPELANASMSFDKNRLVPTYHFIQGVPGRSHALEIARRIGLPEKLIERASSLVEDNQMDIQSAIMVLQEQNKLLEKQRMKLKKEERRAQRRIVETKQEKRSYEALQEKMKLKESERLKKAVARIESEFRDLLKEVESRKTRQKLVSRFSEKQRELVSAERKPEEESVSITSSGKQPEDWREGDQVLLKSWQKKGKLISVDRKQARVDVSGMTMTIPVADLVHTAEKSAPRKERVHLYSDELSSKTIPLELKLIGMKKEHALDELSKMIDAAMLHHPAMLKVVHGHGHGILKQAIRHFLETHPLRSHWELKIDPENDGTTELVFRWY